MAAKRRRSLETDNLTSLGVSEDGEILDDWEQIVKICNAGRAQDFYEVGDWKNANEKKAVLIGFKEETLADKSGFANTSWMHMAYSPQGAYTANSRFKMTYRGLANNTNLDSYPDALKQNIKMVKKRNGYAVLHLDTSGNSMNYSLEYACGISYDCKLWALSCDDLIFESPNYLKNLGSNKVGTVLSVTSPSNRLVFPLVDYGGESAFQCSLSVASAGNHSCGVGSGSSGTQYSVPTCFCI